MGGDTGVAGKAVLFAVLFAIQALMSAGFSSVATYSGAWGESNQVAVNAASTIGSVRSDPYLRVSSPFFTVSCWGESTGFFTNR